MGKKGGDDASAQARADEMKRQEEIRQGTTRIGDIFGRQFTPDYFNQQAQNYMNYATPQLNQQHGDAQKQLTFALARAGDLNSSARSSQEAELNRLYGINRQQVADQALAYKTQAQTSVEDARSNLIATLNATGDAQGAANSAIRRSEALSQPAAYSPLSNLFADFTSTLGQQAAAERAYQLSGGVYGRPGTGLFSRSSGSVKNTWG